MSRAAAAPVLLRDAGPEDMAALAAIYDHHVRHAGLWEAVQDKLVFGENVSQAAQFAMSGSAPISKVIVRSYFPAAVLFEAM